LGETLDDAVGECFDKSAKLLGFDYPGGPQIDHWAQQGNPTAFEFGLPNVPNLDFSFSGLKTGIARVIQQGAANDAEFIINNKADLCASIQEAIIEVLQKKLLKALKITGVKHLVLSGGVAANSGIRNRLKELSDKHHFKLHLPPFEYCTDNAAMIGIVGALKFERGDYSELSHSSTARYNLTQL